HQLLRSRRVRPLGRETRADGSRMGGCGPRRRARRRFRHRLAMDTQCLCALPWIPRAGRRARRIQWQVHDQPDGAARELARHSRRSFPPHLPQLLLSAAALAVHGPATVGLRRLGHDADKWMRTGVVMPAVARALSYRDQVNSSSQFAADALAGLIADPKTLPAKYFYDDAGSLLFERITKLPEYYPTRTELGILATHAAEIGQLLPDQGALIEFGSGACTKASLVLEAAPHVGVYVPVDISSETLRREADTLRRKFPRLTVLPVEAD